MTENLVVDFSRVEAGLKLVARAQGLAVEKEQAHVNSMRAATAAKITAYCAGACALVIVSMGMAIWLARKERIVEVERPRIHPVNAHPAPNLPQQSVAIPQNKIMTKVVQFNTIAAADLRFYHPYLSELVAGHEFGTSNADRWQSAWCYAMFNQDGVSIKLSLERREGTLSNPLVASETERRQLALSDGDITRLRSRCPWQARN